MMHGRMATGSGDALTDARLVHEFMIATRSLPTWADLNASPPRVRTWRKVNGGGQRAEGGNGDGNLAQRRRGAETTTATGKVN